MIHTIVGEILLIFFIVAAITGLMIFLTLSVIVLAEFLRGIFKKRG